MAEPKLYIDQNSQPIPAIEVADDCVQVTFTGSSSATALPSGAKMVRIGLDEDAWIRFGTSGATVAATNGHFFPKGVEVFVVPEGATHVAVISNGTNGNGTIGSVAGTAQQ